MHRDWLFLFFVFLMVSSYSSLFAQGRPNIVWVVSEDNSKHYLKLYEEGGVAMPAIERLAEQGIIFNHAFSQAPVCSVARSTIISGCYAPRIGAEYHRRTELVPMPEGVDMFPAYLRRAGYYTSNNAKEDYNLIKSEGVWDESSQKASYRNREVGQPFFHVQNFGITHEGKLHFSTEKMANHKTRTNPGEVTPFPYHPDSETFRYTYAQYYDLHQQVDSAIATFLQQLEADGLMDDTFIFYYGDHGGVLPRSKGYIYESGLHVPFVVYVPEKWKHLAPVPPGSRVDGFIRFIDLAPSVLNLAGIDLPDRLDGKPFIGAGVSAEELNSRNTVFSYADRFDEKYDLVRAFRKGKYKYMRNYQPFNVDALFNFYRYRMLAYLNWRELYREGKLNEAQRQFFEARPPEALYDLEKDPHEVHNLAGDPAFREVLIELRQALQQQVKTMPDLSFFPEPYFLAHGLDNPVQFGQKNQAEIARLIDIADLSLRSFPEAKKALKQALSAANPWERYWALIVCSTFGSEASGFYKKVKKIMEKDPERLVAVRAAEFLELNNYMDTRPRLLELLKNAATPTEANLMLNTVALLHDTKAGFQMEVPAELFDPVWLEEGKTLVIHRVDYLLDDQ